MMEMEMEMEMVVNLNMDWVRNDSNLIHLEEL